MSRPMTFDDGNEMTFDGSTAAPVRDVRPGTVLAARYRVGAQIGRGTSGRIHLAERIADGREVVVKLSGRAGRRARSQLHLEAHALARLDHTNVVGFVEAGETDELSFVVMEAVRGVHSRGAAVLWLYELASALDHVHARGFVHRDVKPANVMIDEARGNRAVLVDFGLASSYRVRSTQPRMLLVCGTPEYMAPEQALGLEREVGPAADRYALAAVALELLTGELPYDRMPVGKLLTTIVERPPRRPSSLGLGGVALDMVFAKAMARDPERRFASAREQIEAIVRALPRLRPSSRPRTPPPPARTVRVKAA